jgi:hypothetical protein
MSLGDRDDHQVRDADGARPRAEADTAATWTGHGCISAAPVTSLRT